MHPEEEERPHKAQNENIFSLKIETFQMEVKSGLRREPQVKKEEEKSCKLKKMGISSQLTFKLLNGLLYRQLKLEQQKNNDIDITEVTVNASIETTD